MSTSGRGVPGQSTMPGGNMGGVAESGSGSERRGTWQCQGNAEHSGGGSFAPGVGRKKRRRPRPQRGKPRRNSEPHGPRIDVVSRESVFQELEGLLRQIREEAEELGSWPAERLAEYTHVVVNFTKSLEEQADPLSERTRSEYQRIREKLSQALKGKEAGRAVLPGR